MKEHTRLTEDIGSKRLASILESVDAAIITIDSDGIVLDINAATTKLFGFSEAEILGQNVKKLMPAPYREEHDGYLQHHLTTGEKRIIGSGRQVRGLNKNGKTIPLHLSVARFEDEGLIYFTGIIHDLSELEEARSMSSRLGQIVEESVNEIYSFEADSLLFTTANRQALYNLGYTLPELKRLTPVDLVEKLTEDVLRETLAPLIDGSKQRVHLAERILRKNKSIYDADVYLHLSDAFDPPEFVAIVQDVTENRRMLETLRQTQRMESIGNLTGGIAHDFNNILTVVMGNLELLQDEITEPGNRELLQEASDATEMGARLTKRLLAFARRSPLAPKRINVNELIDDLSDMLNRTLGDNIRYRTVLQKALWSCDIDVSELENALVNLAINARDAMPDGGELIIETENVDLDSASLSGRTIDPGAYVRISITDTGTGIEADIKDSIFEPFVSTKLDQHGSGLGLSMVYGFIKQSGGHVFVYSEQDKGSTFSLYLPVTRIQQSSETQTGISPKIEKTEQKTILIAEDDPLVRKLTVRRLERFGHVVIQAADGHEALALLKSSSGVDLVFSDVVMTQGMSGYDLAKEVRSLNPDLPILLTSGYAENIVNAEKLAEAGLSLLRKPYHQKELAERLASIFADPEHE